MAGLTIIFALSVITVITGGYLPQVFAESQSFTVAARDFEVKDIFLKEGDELSFSIFVEGGSNDDIDLIFYLDSEELLSGLVIESHSDEFTAPQTGWYRFVFDNRISILSNKQVDFSIESN